LAKVDEVDGTSPSILLPARLGCEVTRRSTNVYRIDIGSSMHRK
jgi:hypothetical protein